MRVFVYWNLHRKCFSVKSLEGRDKGRVIAHVPSIMLYRATFKVSEAGRQRVLREKRKNVHAGVAGEWLEGWKPECIGERVRYNPYEAAHFATAVLGTPVRTALFADLSTHGTKPLIFAQGPSE
jgi:hypothetical protein